MNRLDGTTALVTGAARGIGEGFGRPTTLPHRTSPRKPHVREDFVSAFHGKELPCPVCTGQQLAFAGDRWTCGGCNGAFVEDKALVPMVEDITRGPWQVPAMKGAAGARKCPVCAEAMVVDKLGTVEIDRCPKDGTWFDQHELGQALIETAEPKGSGGVGSWLKRLFT